MKRSFEDLLGLDPDVVMQHSHIVQSTFSEVINKKFEKFNPVKAKGIANTIEKEFNIDMSGWLEEYQAFRAQKSDSTSVIDRVAMEAAKEKKIPLKKLIAYPLAGLLAIIGAYFLYHNSPLSQIGSEENLSNAQYKNELNRSEEANATAALLTPPSDINDTLPSANLPTVATDKNASSLAPKSTEVNTTIKKDSAQPVKAAQITIETTKKLWYSVRYLDTNKIEVQTIEPGKLEFDGTRPKLFEFGHSQIKIVFGSTLIEAKAGAKARYLLKDGRFTQISEEEENKILGKPSKPKEKNSTN